MKKKSVVFIKKQKKKFLEKKNKILLKLNKQLEDLKIIKVLNKNNILLFFQFISLDSEKDEILFKSFIDKKAFHIYLLKENLKTFLNEKWYFSIKSFNNILSFKNIEELFFLENSLKEKKILILGYYFNNILFYKKDLILSNINIKKIIHNFIKVIRRLKKIHLKANLFFTNYLKKIIQMMILKKEVKYGNS